MTFVYNNFFTWDHLSKPIIGKFKIMKGTHSDTEKSPCTECSHNTRTNLEITEAIKHEPGYVILKSKDRKFYYDAITLGLTETYNMPEFIVNGEYPDEFVESVVRGVVYACSNDKLLLDREAFVLDGMKSGKKIKVTIGIKNLVDAEKEFYMRAAMQRYGKDKFTAKQIIISDTNGNLPWNPFYEGSRQLFLYVHCNNCHKTDDVRFACSKCKYVRYCGVECQKTDWPSHKNVCANAKSYLEEISKVKNP